MEEIVEKRKKLRDRLMIEFPEADKIVVRSACENEKATINFPANAYNSAADKINEISKLASGKQSVQMRSDNDSPGFHLEGQSIDHLLAIFQE